MILKKKSENRSQSGLEKLAGVRRGGGGGPSTEATNYHRHMQRRWRLILSLDVNASMHSGGEASSFEIKSWKKKRREYRCATDIVRDVLKSTIDISHTWYAAAHKDIIFFANGFFRVVLQWGVAYFTELFDTSGFRPLKKFIYYQKFEG